MRWLVIALLLFASPAWAVGGRVLRQNLATELTGYRGLPTTLDAGWYINEDFERGVADCADLWRPMTPFSAPAATACQQTTSCPRGAFCFDLLTDAGSWFYWNDAACDGLVAGVCELEFKFHVVTAGAGISWFSVWADGESSVADHADFEQNAANDFRSTASGIFGAVPTGASGYDLVNGSTYSLVVHLTEDGVNDKLEFWLDLDSGIKRVGALLNESVTSSEATFDPSEIWLGGSAVMDLRMDEVRVRVLP